MKYTVRIGLGIKSPKIIVNGKKKIHRVATEACRANPGTPVYVSYMQKGMLIYVNPNIDGKEIINHNWQEIIS